MDLIALDPGAAEPPYEQLRIQIAGQVNTGRLAAGTRLPTVRALAEELHLAVNTVAKTYRALEADGVVVTEGRRGTFVASRGPARGTEAAAAAAAYVATTRRLGLGVTEATRLVEQAWTAG
ncbi:MAG: GntR family transcriptional regulator [Nocardioides sp.]